MNKPLKQAVNDYLQRHELNPEQIASLQKLSSSKSVKLQTPRLSIGRWASSIALMALLILSYSGITQYQKESMIIAIATEVTKNHANLKPLEIQSNQLEQVRGYFNQLDFLPSDTRLIDQLERGLIGGRYCSIQGRTAAQLRLQSTNGQLSTLFETAYDPQTFEMLPKIEQGGKPLVRTVNGFRVKLWVEKGIVMAWVFHN